MTLEFLKDFEKSIQDVEGIGESSLPPRYWYSTGNYVLNKIISGSFNRGIPQGRLTTFAGPSGSGKSYLAANCIKNAQASGAFVLVVDSENALDDVFMKAIGVDTENNYMYRSVTTVPQTTKVVSAFLQGYKKEYGDSTDAPQVLILIDSLDMLLTSAEVEHFESGEQKGDQGQRNKQLKQMLRTFVQAIKSINATIITTSQVYANQNLLNGEGIWTYSEAVRYSASQIVLLTKLKLKETGETEVKGIRMKCEAVKSRFSQPFQSITISVPYSTGMDPLSGLIDVACNLGILEKRGSRYGFIGEDTSFFSKDVANHAPKILSLADQQKDAYLKFNEAKDEIDENQGETTKDTAARRKQKVKNGPSKD